MKKKTNMALTTITTNYWKYAYVCDRMSSDEYYELCAAYEAENEEDEEEDDD